MLVIEARNAQQILPELMFQLRRVGVRRDSRNGPVLRIPGPCTLLYRSPRERVVFWPQRDANPFFHLLEAMWMLAGRNDVEYPASIVSTMRAFSDNGITFHGAYGHRWRQHFGFDQIPLIAEALRKDPDDRRQVLEMWSARHDLDSPTRDAPCNTHVYFSRDENGALDMMVCNRSNDSVWGAVGSNVVHFSILQEIIAGMIGCEVGRYWQVSNNMHLYLRAHEKLMNELADIAQGSEGPETMDPYARGEVVPAPMTADEHFLQDISFFLSEGAALNMHTSFVRKVLVPFTNTIHIMKEGQKPQKYSLAKQAMLNMDSGWDWTRAGVEWITRREEKYDASREPVAS